MPAWPAVLFLAPLAWLALAYNSLVRRRNRAAAAWSQIDVQLRRRHDLVPNLVEVTERYMRHERDVIQAVAGARAEAMKAGADVTRRARAEGRFAATLGRLYAVMEGYPALKADTIVRDLTEQLATTENRIAFARQHYNDNVMILNTAVDSFPSGLVASLFGIGRRQYFEPGEP